MTSTITQFSESVQNFQIRYKFPVRNELMYFKIVYEALLCTMNLHEELFKISIVHHTECNCHP